MQNKKLFWTVIIFASILIILIISVFFGYKNSQTENNAKESNAIVAENQNDPEKTFMTELFGGNGQFVNYNDITALPDPSYYLKDKPYLLWQPTDSELNANPDVKIFFKDNYSGEWVNVPSGYLISVPLSYYETEENGKTRAYFLAATIMDNCHLCAPYLSGAVFEKNNNNWTLLYANKFITNSIGSFGETPKPDVIEIGNNKKAFKFITSQGNQGYYNDYITILAFINNDFNVVLDNIQLTDNNEWAQLSSDKTFTWSSNITTESVPNSDFYDIIIKKTGTQLNQNGKSVPLNETDAYRWNNDDRKFEIIK